MHQLKSATAQRAHARLGGVTALFTVATFVVAYLTPPRSGPLCASDCVAPPYTDVARFVPRDYIWMYPAIVVSVLLLALVVTLGTKVVEGDRSALRHLGTALATIGVGILVVDYAVQLAVVQPMVVQGDIQGIGFLTQYHPSGLFIGLEDVGYTAIAVSYVLLGLALAGHEARAIRWVLLAGGLLTLVALVVLGAWYGSGLTYRFELAAISLTWLTAVVVGSALAWPGPRRRAGAR